MRRSNPECMHGNSLDRVVARLLAMTSSGGRFDSWAVATSALRALIASRAGELLGVVIGVAQ